MPHIEFEFESAARRRLAVFAYRRSRCRGLRLGIRCDVADWPRLKDEFFAAAQSIECKKPCWPGLPAEGYTVTAADGFELVVVEGVPATAVRRIRKLATELARDFERRCGAIVRPVDEPAQIVVHRTAGDAAALHGQAATAEYGAFARRLTDLLFVERFGDTDPNWVRVGLGMLAEQQGRTGRGLPVVGRDRGAAGSTGPRGSPVASGDAPRRDRCAERTAATDRGSTPGPGVATAG